MTMSALFAFVDAVSKKNPEQNDALDLTDSITTTRQSDRVISDTLALVDSTLRTNTRETIPTGDTAAVTDSVTVGLGVDPSNTYLTGWWKAPYNGTSFPANASLGPSGTPALTGGPSPGTGTALNGLNTADFPSTASMVTTAVSGGTVQETLGILPVGNNLSIGDYTMAVLIQPRTITLNSTNGQNNLIISAQGSGTNSFVLEFKNTTPVAQIVHFNVNTAVTTVATIPVTVGVWVLIQARYSIGAQLLEIRVNGGSWNSVTTGPPIYAPSPLNATSRLLIGSAGTTSLDARVAEIMIANIKHTDATLNNLRSYINGKYALSV